VLPDTAAPTPQQPQQASYMKKTKTTLKSFPRLLIWCWSRSPFYRCTREARAGAFQQHGSLCCMSVSTCCAHMAVQVLVLYPSTSSEFTMRTCNVGGYGPLYVGSCDYHHSTPTPTSCTCSVHLLDRAINSHDPQQLLVVFCVQLSAAAAQPPANARFVHTFKHYPGIP
jgi:hypothetical protein